ncbi:MAG: hypothetical protein RLZZ546_1777 [Bacteroidota bacterium]|jgi:ribosomal protein S18 acetylase RimI-like enzyme
MRLKFRQSKNEEIDIALSLLKQAAQKLKDNNINQWAFWLDPPDDKIDWIKKGFENNEFFFVETDHKEIVAMFRLSEKDEMYWGNQNDDAYYIHSLVVDKNFSGKKIGIQIIQLIESLLLDKGIFKLRLDCNASNLVLCNYYEMQGFVKVGEKQMPHSLNNLFEKSLL